MKLDDINEGLSDATRGIQRKPLPPNPKLDLGDRPEPSPKVYPYFPLVSQELRNISNARRKPVGDDNKQSTPLAEPAPSLPARKLLGPRPLHSRQISVDAAALEVNTRKENMALRRWSEQPPMSTKALELLSRPGLLHQRASSNIATEDVSTSGETEIGPRFEEGLVRDPNFSITMIRRDPTSSGQWNVGKISAVSNGIKCQVSHGPRNVSPQGGDSGFLIEITTPGYVKFIEVDKALPLSMTTTTNLLKTTIPTAGFQRHLLTKTSPPVSKNPSSNNNILRNSPNTQGYSAQSNTSPEEQRRPCFSYPESSLINTKAYTFVSPWNGKCEFTTGIAGRSLKCKHTLPSVTASPGKDASPAVTVSELRFNLPSSKMFGPASPRRPPLSAASPSCTESFFLNDNGINRPLESVDFDDQDNTQDEESANQIIKLANGYEDHVDGLGREHAGGGLRGNQAKLGKLIIKDEGLKMLDLLVAANMGIWWGVYGRAE